MVKFHFDVVKPLAIQVFLNEHINDGWEIVSLELVKEDGQFFYYVFLKGAVQ